MMALRTEGREERFCEAECGVSNESRPGVGGERSGGRGGGGRRGRERSKRVRGKRKK